MFQIAHCQATIESCTITLFSYVLSPLHLYAAYVSATTLATLAFNGLVPVGLQAILRLVFCLAMTSVDVLATTTGFLLDDPAERIFYLTSRVTQFLCIALDLRSLFDGVVGVTNIWVPRGSECCEICGVIMDTDDCVKHHCTLDSASATRYGTLTSSATRSPFGCHEDASFLSRITFSWMNAFVSFLSRNANFMTTENATKVIPTLPSSMQSHTNMCLPAISLFRQFRKPNAKEKAEVDGSSSILRPIKFLIRTLFVAPLLSVSRRLFLQFFVDQATRKEFDSCGFRTLFELFTKSSAGRRFFLYCVPLKLTQDVLAVCSPIIVSYLIHFIKNVNSLEHSGAVVDATDAFRGGIIICLVMFASLALQSLFFQNYLRQLYLSGTEATIVIRTLILEKLISTPLASLTTAPGGGAATEGTVISLITVDAARCGETLIFLHNSWGHPFMVACSLGLLVYYVGFVAAAASLCSLLIMIPLNKHWSGRIQEAQKTAVASQPRVSLCNEVLSSMRLVKANVWEKSLLEKLTTLRHEESRCEEKILKEEASASFVSEAGGVLVCCACFVAYYAAGGELVAETLVPALASINLLRFPIWSFPGLLSTISRGVSSMKRLDQFLGWTDDSTSLTFRSTRTASLPPGTVQCMTPTSFAYNSGGNQVLEGILLSVKPGELVGIKGPVGCGKSSLLLAIMGELCATATMQSSPKTNVMTRKPVVHSEGLCGFRVGGSVAYCGEVPWLRNETVRKNICMNLPFDAEWYYRVITACALSEDFSHLPQHDQSIVGDKGVQLSGGQKARVALARAVYSRCDTYLLDGVLEALDHRSQQIITTKVFHGLLKNKTRIVVAHTAMEMIFPHRWFEAKPGGCIVECMHTSLAPPPFDDSEQMTSSPETRAIDGAVVAPTESLKHTIGVAKLPHTTTDAVKKYLNAFGWNGVFVVLSSVVHQLLQTSMDVWFGFWISRRVTTGISFLTLYAALGLLCCIFAFVKTTVFFKSCVAVANKILITTLTRLMRAPVSFFDITPSGTISSILSKDVDTMDRAVPESVRLLLQTTLQLTAIVVFNSVLSPVFILVIPFTVTLFFNVSTRFLIVSKEVRKLENRSIGGVVAIAKEVYEGGPSLRCCVGSCDALRQEFCEAIDVGTRARDVAEQLDRWVGLRLELVSTTLATTAAFISVIYSAHIPPAFAGVAVVNCLNSSRILLMLCRRIGMFQVQFMSIEQVMKYHSLPEERSSTLSTVREVVESSLAADNVESVDTKSAVELRNVNVRYRESLTTLSIKNLSLRIARQSRVALVGRSGSGKSTIFNSLLGLADIIEGDILLNGKSVSAFDRGYVRSRFTVIPQDPLILKGTWRSNLRFGVCDSDDSRDDEKEEERMWYALRTTQLDCKASPLLGLDTPVEEGGNGLSAGEKQLFCLARALMKDPPSEFVLLDEVSAHVDQETDKKIQSVIDAHFCDSTILMIAHRLQSLRLCDTVVVMSDGELRRIIHKERNEDLSEIARITNADLE